MNIVIISSSDTGGAGIAALRLHKALLASGANSHFLCFNKSSNVKNVIQIIKPLSCRIIEHLPIPFWNNRYRKIAPLVNKDYECISFPESIDYISRHPIVKEADVINLHWVGNCLSYKSFFKKIKKPIIWTLHDMNPFLGCAHFSRDVNSYPQWLYLENRIRKKKEKWIHCAKHIEIINLCNWMQEYSASTEVFGKCSHHIIRNSIDTTIFKEYPQQPIRKIFNIPSNKTVLIFVSQAINNTRKGFDLLLKALESVKNCYIMMIGICDENLNINNNIRYIGNVCDEKLIALYYAAADVFLLPSREDNLPNTMLESLCCGTPVVTMPNGGMTDIIKNGLNGYICKEPTSESFAQAINEFIQCGVSMKRSDISNEAKQMFSPKIQAKEYLDVFQKAIEEYEKNL